VIARVAPAGPVPWRPAHLAVLWVTVAVGATLLMLAWWGASATASGSSQVAWIDIGVCGLLVAGVGITSWVFAGRRAVGARRMRLLPDALHATARAADAPSVDERGGRLVTAAHLTRYHRAGCPMVAGKSVRAATEARHRAAGLEPCGVCLPTP
jgi:hypothetical protein